MAPSFISRSMLWITALFLLGTLGRVYGYTTTAAPSSFVTRHSHNKSPTQLSMALALPTSRPLKRKRWYEDSMPIKRRFEYYDDFDLYDEFGNLRGRAPFEGIQSAPIVFSSSTFGAPQRKRDKVKRAAKWIVRKVRRD